MNASFLQNNEQWALLTRGFCFVIVALLLSGAVGAQDDPCAEPDEPGLPPGNMDFEVA